MINAIANYTHTEIERATRDEFERDTLYKACAIGITLIQFLELVVAAILAWVPVSYTHLTLPTKA